MKWDKEKIELLTKFYPTKGKLWCVENLGFTEAQVRQKASRLKLKAMGNSEAWLEGQIKAAQAKVGKKRPMHSEVMKKHYRLGIGAFASFSKEYRTQNSIKMWEEKRKESEKWFPFDLKNLWEEKRKFDPRWHPRGMAGKKHTEECKALIGEKSKLSWKSMTQGKKQQRTIKIAKSRFRNGNYIIPRPHVTWKQGWRDIGGHQKYYRSRWEANYARYLQWLKERGEIKSWTHESKIFWFEGIKRGTVSYLPDFCVIEKNGEEVYHEVKGWMDKRSLTKLKRMKKYYPNVRLVVIARKEYEAITKTVSKLIKEWE